MRPMLRHILLAPLLAALALTAAPARAHPHEFIDATLELRFDASGALAEIGVEWRYDAFTSMLILADLGLNPAAETLTPEDEAILSGFDLNWVDGYDGDLWPMQGDTALALGPPQPVTTTLEEGQIISRHRRPVLTPADPASGPLVIQVYDPEYYVAYTIAGQAAIEGRDDCLARIFAPDLSAANAQLEAAMDELYAGGAVDLEADFPAVGRDFAEEIRIDCAPEAE